MRTELLGLGLLLVAGLAPAETILLLDGLDPTLLDAYDASGDLLAPELRRFCAEASAIPNAQSALTHGEAGVAAFFHTVRSPVEFLVEIASAALPSDLRIVPLENFTAALAGSAQRILLHLPEDPTRPIDEELLWRTDPTPWAGAERAVDHRQQRENRRQRGQMLLRLRAENRLPRHTADTQDQDWLARYRLAELERLLAPALSALRAADGSRVVLSALHGPRTHNADLSPRARRVPYFVWPATAPMAAPQASWSFSALPGDPAFGFAHWTERLTLRAELGKLQLFDRRFDPQEILDLAPQQPALLTRLQDELSTELVGADATLHLRLRSPRGLRLLLPGMSADRLVQSTAAKPSERSGTLVVDFEPGTAELSLRLQAQDAPPRLQGDVRGCRLLVGRSEWPDVAQLRLDLASGALLAALAGAPRDIERSNRPDLMVWIER
jgi:hypothetical protein